MCNTKKYKIFAAYLQKTKKSAAAATRLKAAFLQPQKFYNSHEILVKKTKSVDLLSNETFLKKNILCKRRFGISYQYTTYILLHIISPVDWLAGGELRRGNISLVQLLQSRQKFFLAKALSTKVNTQIELSFKNDSNDKRNQVIQILV